MKNIANVYLKDDKYFAYDVSGKKLCQSKSILEIENCLIHARWTKKAQEAAIDELVCHFDVIEARNIEIPVVITKSQAKTLVEKTSSGLIVIANDDFDPPAAPTKQEKYKLKIEAHQLLASNDESISETVNSLLVAYPQFTRSSICSIVNDII